MFKEFFKKMVKSALGDMSYSSLVAGGGDTPLSGNVSVAQLLNSYKNWVYTCVDKIAESISGIELELRKYNSKGDDVEIYDHIILDLLNRPNPLMTGRDFLYIIAGHMDLTGNAYLLLDQPKNPKAMFPLDPSKIRANFNENGTSILNYTYTVGAKTFTYASDIVLHLKYPSLRSAFKGAGTLEHITEWVDIDSAATEFNRIFFKNGAAPSGLLETEATTQKELELAKAGFEMRYSGVLNSHKTAVLGKGVKYTVTSSTPKDMEFSEMDNRFRDKILSAFGVPKSVLGIVEDVNRANAEASYYVFMKFTIDPKMKRIVAYLNEYLLPLFSGSENLYFDYENIIPENDELILRQNQVALAGQSYKTINEVRAEDGLPPIENGDFVYGGFATVPIGRPIKQNNALPVPQEKKKAFKSERMKKSEKKDKLVDDIIEKVMQGDLVTKTRKEIDEIAHKEFITRVSKYESGFIKAVKDFDEKIEKMVIEDLEGSKSFDFVNKDLFNQSQAQQLFIGFTSPILQDLLKTEGQAQMDRLDTGTPFNPLNESIQDKLKKLLNLTAQSYTGTTLKLLNAQLQDGVSNGESLAQLTNRVRDVFSLTLKYRAETVARTTVFGVANNAARDAYKQSGVVKTVVWHTAEDELVCEFCGPLDGKTVGVDDDFFEKGDVLRGADGGVLQVNFDDVEDPPVHANCRCFTNAGMIEVERQAGELVETKDDEDSEAIFLKQMLDVLEPHE